MWCIVESIYDFIIKKRWRGNARGALLVCCMLKQLSYKCLSSQCSTSGLQAEEHLDRSLSLVGVDRVQLHLRAG